MTICKAICCKFPFALSKQDVEERIIRWEFGRPYLIAHDAEGYCVHLERQTSQCTAYDHRPVPCRGFDCQYDEKWKIWLDYEKKILNTRSINFEMRHLLVAAQKMLEDLVNNSQSDPDSINALSKNVLDVIEKLPSDF